MQLLHCIGKSLLLAPQEGGALFGEKFSDSGRAHVLQVVGVSGRRDKVQGMEPLSPTQLLILRQTQLQHPGVDGGVETGDGRGNGLPLLGHGHLHVDDGHPIGFTVDLRLHRCRGEPGAGEGAGGGERVGFVFDLENVGIAVNGACDNITAVILNIVVHSGLAGGGVGDAGDDLRGDLRPGILPPQYAENGPQQDGHHQRRAGHHDAGTAADLPLHCL